MSVAGPGSRRSVESSLRPGALPTPLTSFIGRKACCADVAELLDGHRLVTLTGSGGCGKTRLALEVARTVASRFADRGVFVDLSPVESGALVVNSVAATCGVPETGAAPLLEMILRALAERHLLVVLDNCEHLVDECAPLAHQVLTRCPGVAVLATSREPLGVDGEVTYRVPPLTVPGDSRDPQAALEASEAGQLLLDRAALARPGYRFTGRDAAAAVGVCRRLDGVPLAIELAASRLRVLDPTALGETLGDHFDVLGEGPRTAPPRQRTLQASIDWGHELLHGRERRVFRRLGVFAGRFSAETAAAVCAGTDMPADEVSMVLTELVDRSLVQVDEAAVENRYRLLEAVRDYARSRLAEAGETETLRDRHLDHHLAVAERFADEPGQGSASDEALERIAATLDDLRAAMDWSIRSGQVEKGLRTAAGLRAFWVARSQTAEGRAHLARLLDADTGRDVRTRASALIIAAQLADYAADPTSVRDLATEALELVRARGDRALEGPALTMLGWAAAFLDPAAAPPLFEKALDELGRAGHDRLIEFGEMGLAVALLNGGDLAGAAKAFSDTVARARARGTWGLPFGLGMLGYVQALRGAFDDADALLREAVPMRYGAYQRFNEDLSRQWLALLQTFRGDYEGAASIHDEALAYARARGAVPVLALFHGALLDVAQDNFDRAISRVSAVLSAVRRIGWRWLEAHALRLLGDAAAGRGDHETADARWREAAVAADASGNPVAQALAALGLAREADARGDSARARSEARQALRHALGAEYRIGAVDALEALAVLRATTAGATTTGTAPDAARLLAAVDAERVRVGYARFPVDRPGFEHAVAVARDTLGARFESAWEQGSALAFDDAVALATRGERRPPRPPSGWASLTPAELRVARLVAGGLTNPQIAERLFISARTVQTHLSRVFAKLDVSGRAELAAAISQYDSPSDSAT